MEKAPLKKNKNKKKTKKKHATPTPPCRKVEGFHTSRTENITLKSPQDGLIYAGT